MTGRVRPSVRIAVVLAGLLSGALAGCSAEIVRADAPTSTADGDSRSAPEGRTPPTTPTGSQDTVPTEHDVATTLDRAGLLAAATQHVTCGGGDLVLSTAVSAVAVDDDCATLTVAGTDTTVVAGDVERLVVQGAAVRVVVARVGSVEIDAADVRVAWEDGTPRVDDRGAANVYGPVGTVGLDGSDGAS